ncbi:MAG TPA: FemAB family XrtA/PEP-CTERM system-associated protein [Syntrophobacteraceae bacterium]|nr:FemAB family XrtA/PEP-CTERM system-associated protein [Syntrophobacteraceae bacterium]
MNVRFYQTGDRKSWDDFVLKHPKGTFFHLSGWKKVVEDSFGHSHFYLIAEHEQGKSQQPQYSRSVCGAGICGVFPLFLIKSFLFGKCLVSIPFAAYGGILADDPITERALFDKAVELTRSHDLDYMEIRSGDNGLPELPSKDLYYIFKKDLLPDKEANMLAIPRKARRMIRLGISQGLEPVFGGRELLGEFYDLLAYNFRSLGTPVFPKRYLAKLLDEFQDSCFILIIRKEGNPLSGVLSFLFKDEMIPYYSGAYTESRDYAANDFLYWALMSDAVDRGCRVFDFGRSKKETGPFNFKRHWGFEPAPLPYKYYLHRMNTLPEINPSNPKYKSRIELWKKLPLWFTKCIGPQIVKYIP